MRAAAIVLFASFALSACVSSEEFYQQPFDAVEADPRPYQQVYASTLQTARSCIVTGLAGFGLAGPQQYRVDSELYSDLGYGDIEMYLEGFGRFPVWQVRMTRAASGGTEISYRISAPTDRARANEFRRISTWARGGTDCTP